MLCTQVRPSILTQQLAFNQLATQALKMPKELCISLELCKRYPVLIERVAQAICLNDYKQTKKNLKDIGYALSLDTSILENN